MLKQRILTALALIPLVIAAIWYLPPGLLAVPVAMLMLVCLWEWALFIPLAGWQRLAYVALGAALMALAHPHYFGQELTPIIVTEAVGWWAVATVWLALYPRGFAEKRPSAVVRAFLGLMCAVPCYVAIWNLQTLPDGRWLVFLLLALVWATDTGGYFVGKRFGKRKLAAQVSPKKTWEGFWGGVGLAAVLALVAAYLVFDQPAKVMHFVLLGLGVASISVVGDLTVSMFKRQTGIKDTGQLFPGHGGALDRLDSLMSGAPVLFFVYVYMSSMS